MRPVRSLLLVISALAAVLMPSASAAALSYPVTSTADTLSKGTLRGSIEEANAHTGADSIPIDVTGTIGLTSALPPITDDVAIGGPGANFLTVERSSATEFRIFDFTDGVAASLTGLTVSGGANPQGGGIRNGSGSLTLARVVVADNEAADEGGPEADAEGGGVFSAGPLTVRESVIRDNSALAAGGGTLTSALGGGVMASGPVTVDRSTISGNAAEAHGEGGSQSRASGGGLRLTGGPAVVERSTISGNSVVADASLTNAARGGGLQGDALTLASSTVTGNSLFSIGTATGANIEFAGTTLIRDTIVANPIGDAGSCGAPLTSGGYNLDEDGSCQFGQGSDLANVDPLLEPLAENGGPTPTHALTSGSIAIDRGNSFGATTDQRGLPRPSDFATISNKEGGDGSDIGAFELQAPPAPPPGVVIALNLSGDRRAPNTRIVSGPARAGYKLLAKFRFASTEPQSHFQCKFDAGKWRGCRNPWKHKVSAGAKHLFKVRAIDRFGNVDPTPAQFGWRVKKVGG